jgi:SagB-type dehydrogenase family enzyme
MSVGQTVSLPDPIKQSTVSIEQALQNRRSVREYSKELLSIEQIGQLLWAAQGVTGDSGERTAPSAGALYPLEVYVTGQIGEKESGFYLYHPDNHSLSKESGQDLREALAAAAYDQEWIKNAPINIIITAFFGRLESKYGEKAVQFSQLEAGHAAQNVLLQVVSLGLGAVTIGGFDDEQVNATLGLTDDETPLYIIPVGNK